MRATSPIRPVLPNSPLLVLPPDACQQNLEESALQADLGRYPAHGPYHAWAACQPSGSAGPPSPPATMGKRRPRRRSSVVYPTPPPTTASGRRAVPLPVTSEHECPARAPPDLPAPAAATDRPAPCPPLSPPPTTSLPVLCLSDLDDDSMSLLMRPAQVDADALPLPRLATGLLTPAAEHSSKQLLTPLSPAWAAPASLDAIPEAEDEQARTDHTHGHSFHMNTGSPFIRPDEMTVLENEGMNLDTELPSLSSAMYPPRSSPMLPHLGLFLDDEASCAPPSPFARSTDLPDLGLFAEPSASASPPWLSVPNDIPSPRSPPETNEMFAPEEPSRWATNGSRPQWGAAGRSPVSPRPPSATLPDLDMESLDPPAWMSEPGSSRTSTLESLPVATPESSWLEPSPWSIAEEAPSCTPSPRPPLLGLPDFDMEGDSDSSMSSAETSLLLASPPRRAMELPQLTIDTARSSHGRTASDGLIPVYHAHFTSEPDPLSACASPKPRLRELPDGDLDGALLPVLAAPLRRALTWPTPHPASLALAEPPPAGGGLGLDLFHGAGASPPDVHADLDEDPLLLELGLPPPPPASELGALCAVRRRSLGAERAARSTEACLAARIRTLEDALLARRAPSEPDALPPRLELQALGGLRADARRTRKRERARARELGALLRLKLAGPARSRSLPALGPSAGFADAADAAAAEAQAAARAAIELAAQMVLRRREAAGGRPLLSSSRDRRSAYVRSPLLRMIGDSDEEDEAAAMAVE